MMSGWFTTLLSVIYGSLLVIVIAWLGQRTAKSIRPGPALGGETGDWVASVFGTIAGLAVGFVVTRRMGITPMFMPVVLLGGLWIGGIMGSLSVRLGARAR